MTGRFNNIAVEVNPGVEGLHVTFKLEPALYFGILDFPGTGKAFSYTKLLQVIDIPNDTPYKQDVVSKSAENLRQFFVSSGFFQAEVQPELQFDETHMLANVLFHINLGKRAKVGNVEIQGTEPAEADRLRQVTRSLRATATGASLKPGKPYTQKRIDSATKLMKRDLANQHHLASKIGLDHPEYRPETNHADLVFNARLGPIVKVQVTGAKLSTLPFFRERQIRKLIPIFSEGTVDPDLVEEGRRNLIDFFQGKGYFNVKVAADLQIQASNLNLLYSVDRGHRQTSSALPFAGKVQRQAAAPKCGWHYRFL